MSHYTPISDRTFEFAVRITKLCTYLDKQPGTPRLLANQLFRSGTSIGANIEESRSAESNYPYGEVKSIKSKVKIKNNLNKFRDLYPFFDF